MIDVRDPRTVHVAWSVLVEPGDRVGGVVRRVLGAEESLRLAWEQAPGSTWMRALEEAGVGSDELSARDLQAAVARWYPRVDDDAVVRALRQADRWRQQVLIPGDPDWPTQVDDLGDHAPACLYVRGDTTLLAASGSGSLAVVGTRAPSSYGLEVATMLAEAAVQAGAPVISGGAFGIDARAHEVSLALGGSTVAVLAGGLDRLYPTGNQALLERVEQHGALVSEVPSGVAPTRWRFLQRNRLIAALSTATVVAEAAVRSGARNTAAHAAELGRPLGAVPGSVFSGLSGGCHRILTDYGAAVIEREDDVVSLLRGEDAHGPLQLGEPSADEQRLLDALSTRTARPLDEAARAAGLAPGVALSIAGILELTGAIEQHAGGYRKLRR